MPIKAYNEEGEEIPEVYTPDELAELKQKADAAAELEKKLKEVEETPEKINWKAVREKEKRMAEALKSRGVELDAEGNPINTEQVSADYVNQKAHEIAGSQIVSILVEDALEEYGDQKSEVQDLFNALTANKQVDRKNYREFLEKAARAAGIQQEPQNIARRFTGISGHPPIQGTDTFDDTAEGKQVGSMLGLKSFNE